MKERGGTRTQRRRREKRRNRSWELEIEMQIKPKNGRKNGGKWIKGMRQRRKGKESENRFAIFRLGEDIHAVSIRHSFASSPSGLFLCLGTQFL